MRAANYVEETTTSIAGSSGDGAVTLTQITSVPRFSTVFGSGTVLVRYVIEDTVNKKFETGFGSVASNVLTRTYPVTTWDGTTWDDTAPSALQFGSSPTSGDIKIRMSPTVETMAATMPGVQTTITSGADSWQFYPLSAHLIKSNNTGGNSTALGNGTEHYQYYKLERAGRLTGMQFEINAVTGTANLKTALFPIAYNGAPGTKILDFVTTAYTTTGVKTDTNTASWSSGAPVYLNPGWYAIGFQSDSTTLQLRIYLNANQANIATPTPLGSFTSYLSYKSRYYVAGTYSSGFANPPTLTGGTIDHPIWTGLRVEP